MNADGSGQVNLTNQPAHDSGAWWSPDGSEIAFQSFRNVHSDIFIMDADGSNVRQLTDDGAVDGGLRWSPDGTKVAYYSFIEQVRGFLWVANSDGSGRKAVLESIHPAGPEVQCAGGFPGGWFPDGQRILFRGSFGAERATQICAVNSDGSDIRVIFGEPETSASSFPALSPDGARIAFSSDRDGNEEVYVMDAGGSNLRRVTKDDGIDMNPAWSPDGQWLVFASNRDGDFDIYVVQADGKGLRKLTDNTAGDIEPAWSPRE